MKILKKLLNKYLPWAWLQCTEIEWSSPPLQHPASQVNLLKMPLELKEPLQGIIQSSGFGFLLCIGFWGTSPFCLTKWETRGGFPPQRGDGIFLNHEISSWQGEHLLTCVVGYPALRKDALEQGGEPHTPQCLFLMKKGTMLVYDI